MYMYSKGYMCTHDWSISHEPDEFREYSAYESIDEQQCPDIRCGWPLKGLQASVVPDQQDREQQDSVEHTHKPWINIRLYMYVHCIYYVSKIMGFLTQDNYYNTY